MSDTNDIPRFRITIQDGVTEIQVSAGTDELDKFTKVDLMKMINYFKRKVRQADVARILKASRGGKS